MSSARLARTLGLGGAVLAGVAAISILVDIVSGSHHWMSWLGVVLATLMLVTAGIASSLPEQTAPVDGDAKRRLWIVLGVLAWVAVQLVIPLRYYLGHDAYDERFSWRMFSAVRMQTCQLSAFETRGAREEPLTLDRLVQAGWINTLERNREQVMDRFLEWRCVSGARHARLVNQCVSPAGEAIPPIERDIDCGTGVIERRGGM